MFYLVTLALSTLRPVDVLTVMLYAVALGASTLLCMAVVRIVHLFIASVRMSSALKYTVEHSACSMSSKHDNERMCESVERM